MTRFVILVMLVALTGCGSADARYEIALSSSEIARHGANMTGRIDISETEWVRIATRGCNEGAWDWDVAEQIYEEELGDQPDPLGPQSIWLLLTATCHELIPQDAIDRGPPGF
ncbi:MAG: hypothetical protein GY926_16235 [bacterium]|nr:hypothetical protein [bacterium]